MQKYTLIAKKRTLVGRKVKKLRKEGSIPGTIYGKNIESKSIIVEQASFEKTFKLAGETGVIELSVDGKAVPVLIHSVQRDPVTSAQLHVEFYQVDLKEKVKTNVPVIAVGESPVVTSKAGVLLTLLSEVEVEALPADLPEKLELDVTVLVDVDQELRVSDIVMPKGVVLLSEPDVSVFKVSPLVSREAEKEAADEAAADAEVAATEASDAKEPAVAEEAPAK